MKSGLKLLLGFFIFLFLFSGGLLVTKLLLTPVAIATKTFDADNVIANYEWFKRQYNEIQAFDSKLKISKKALEAAQSFAGDTFEDRQELNRLRSVVLGLESQMNDMIAAYNARSQMANRDIFRTNDLPEFIASTQ